MKKQAGNYYVHISEYDDSEVAVMSRATGEIVVWDTKWTRKSKRLRSVREEFYCEINDERMFTFSHMTNEKVNKLIKMLK